MAEGMLEDFPVDRATPYQLHTLTSYYFFDKVPKRHRSSHPSSNPTLPSYASFTLF